MTTEKGRVVYERPKHIVNTADTVRFVKAIAESNKLGHVADAYARSQIRYLYDREATWLQAIAFMLRTLLTTATWKEISLKELLFQLSEALKTAEWLGFL